MSCFEVLYQDDLQIIHYCLKVYEVAQLIREAKLMLIWKELFKPDSYLATFVWKGQNEHYMNKIVLMYGKSTSGWETSVDYIEALLSSKTHVQRRSKEWNTIE